ncbi:protein C10 [Aethina tumida]|uniref:protein C10 n=1 Tax=Aethina tumida TaxID=116153 RepID=UPI0021497D07|nr:protein C10 [Aethina tumida]
MSEIPPLSSETAIQILNRTLEELNSPTNTKKLEEARDDVGNEMLKMLQYVFPLVLQVQSEIIKDFGYPEGREGMIKFALAIRELEREDVEVARLHSLVKAYYLPPVSVNAMNEEERTSSN